MDYPLIVERESDGRSLAEVARFLDATPCGATSKEAVPKVQTPALRVVADRLGHCESGSMQIRLILCG